MTSTKFGMQPSLPGEMKNILAQKKLISIIRFFQELLLMFNYEY